MSIAVVVGASGGVGRAVLKRVRDDRHFETVVGLGRTSTPSLDLLDEPSIAACAKHVADLPGDLRLLIVATGVLRDGERMPEKAWRQLDPDSLARQFAINAIGPTLVLKHLLPLLPKQGRSVCACLSARVGSIGDNHLGGWYGYRASKAALNQLVRTASVELARSWPEAICVALHPGTVATALSRPFVGEGPNVVSPELAAERLLTVVEGLRTLDTGGFFDQTGHPIAW